MASRLLRCAAYIALLFAADGIRVVLGMGSVL